jgi:hypothetical protein
MNLPAFSTRVRAQAPAPATGYLAIRSAEASFTNPGAWMCTGQAAFQPSLGAFSSFPQRLFPTPIDEDVKKERRD